MAKKCRRRMNGIEEYITTKITLKGKEKRKRPRKKREAPGM